MIRALLIERAGYQRMGRVERAQQVTEQLEQLGYTEPTPALARDDVKPSRGTRTAKG